MESKSILKTSVNQKQQKIEFDDQQCSSENYERILAQNARSKSDVILSARNQYENLLSVKSQIAEPIDHTLKIPCRIQRSKTNLSGFQMYRKIKKNKKKKNSSDYRKNICGYITKKIIREFTSPNYNDKVKDLCSSLDCDYNEVKTYYSSKIQHVTGPSHIPGLLIAENVGQQKIKMVFKQFFKWFLNQRYLRYLLLEGKMTDKRAYIEYKNNTLLGLISNKLMEGLICKQEPNQRISQISCVETKQQQEYPLRHTIIHIPIVMRHNAVKQQY